MRRRNDLILNAVNPGSIDSPIQDITLEGGYSLHFIVTGTLQFTSTVYAGNVNDPTKLSVLSGTATVINNTGYINNTSFAQYDYFFVRITAVTGTGTLQCSRTIKEL